MTEVPDKIGFSKSTKIVTLNTDFKSLRYKDYSNGTEPLVSKNIEKYSSTKNQNGWYRQYAQGTLTEITNRADDVVRITKWVATPRGVLWEARQAALEDLQTNLVAKRRNTETGGILKRVGEAILSSAELTASTLAQVAASETGYRTETFLPRAYLAAGKSASVLNQLLATFYKDSTISQFSGVQQVIGGQKVNIINADWDTSASFSLINRRTSAGTEFGRDSIEGKLSTTESRMFAQNDKEVIVSREEWDETSTLNEKTTTYSRGEVIANLPKTPDSGSKEYVQNGKTITVDSDSWNTTSDITLKTSEYQANASIKVPKQVTGTTYDSRAGLKTSAATTVKNEYTDQSYYLKSSDGNLKSKDSAYSLDGKAPSGDSSDQNTIATSKANKYSDSNKYYSKSSPGKVDKALGGDKYISRNADLYNLVPFIFSAYNANGDLADSFSFEATLDSLSDSYTGDWGETQYIGRGDKFYTYNGFTREISFKFVAVAKHSRELRTLYKHLNWLASTTAPTYDSECLFMQGVLAELTIGEYLQKQTGFFTKIDLNWTPDYMWDIEGEGGIIVPMALDVSVSFTPIHKFNARHADEGYFGIKKGTDVGQIFKANYGLGDDEEPTNTVGSDNKEAKNGSSNAGVDTDTVPAATTGDALKNGEAVTASPADLDTTDIDVDSFLGALGVGNGYDPNGYGEAVGVVGDAAAVYEKDRKEKEEAEKLQKEQLKAEVLKYAKELYNTGTVADKEKLANTEKNLQSDELTIKDLEASLEEFKRLIEQREQKKKAAAAAAAANAAAKEKNDLILKVLGAIGKLDMVNGTSTVNEATKNQLKGMSIDKLKATLKYYEEEFEKATSNAEKNNKLQELKNLLSRFVYYNSTSLTVNSSLEDIEKALAAVQKRYREATNWKASTRYEMRPDKYQLR